MSESYRKVIGGESPYWEISVWTVRELAPEKKTFFAFLKFETFLLESRKVWNAELQAWQRSEGTAAPRVVRQGYTRYTAAAMRAKVHGDVGLELVVLEDGTVGDVRIVKELDLEHGLDREAVAATTQMRFTPGTRDGEPVPVLVTFAMGFTLN